MDDHGSAGQPPPPPPPRVDALDQARADLEGAEQSDDATRLEVLEDVRRKLEAELEAGVENGSTRH